VVLDSQERRKLDERDDRTFYDGPRYVTHVDEGFLDRLTDRYASLLANGDRVFDAMSSHVSHLPDYEFERVVGHGMNAEELAANPRLDDWFVRNLNEEPELPFEDGSFDAVLCAVSVQYLQRPEAVFAAFGRVLAPGGVLVVSFSNRMFPTKAIRAWRERDMDGRAALVTAYVDSTGLFDEPSVVRERPERDPFYAVVARRRA
jgi:SAM-dependent methyltransferase